MPPSEWPWYLSKRPVDTLKIDRSFVIDMTSSAEGLALVSSIINMAHALTLKVVAEGVETEEQSRLLRLPELRRTILRFPPSSLVRRLPAGLRCVLTVLRMRAGILQP
jgi:hypothetical protein